MRNKNLRKFIVMLNLLILLVIGLVVTEKKLFKCLGFVTEYYVVTDNINFSEENKIGYSQEVKEDLDLKKSWYFSDDWFERNFTRAGIFIKAIIITAILFAVAILPISILNFIIDIIKRIKKKIEIEKRRRRKIIQFPSKNQKYV